MYKKSYGGRGGHTFNRFGGGGGRSGGFRGGGRGGFKRIKSFDPSSVVNAPQLPTVTTEFIATHAFADFNVSDELKKNISDKGYTTPTPVQDQAIEPILEGRDLIGVANTGTGKTAAFLIPLIDKVFKSKNEKVLIVAPTRELAFQIKDELMEFSRGMGIFSCLCIGGTNLRRQKDDLRRNPNFVIGTPGRLLDLIKTHNLNLSGVASVVLDEVDRIVDIGFINDIRFIISLLPKERQSLFFSATVDGKVREILSSFVQNPVTVSVKTRETAENIEQKIVNVSDKEEKVEKLHEMLIQKEYEKVLVFGRTKHGVQRLSEELIARGFKADAIHGNKKQGQRTRTLENFKNDRIQILIATDVASRGLDIPNVSHVINFDLPESYEAYIHRIGRTGRANKKGTALTFVERAFRG